MVSIAAILWVKPQKGSAIMAALSAVQQIRRMRGGSQSHLMRASDGHYYITKFQNNPQHCRILANEFLASRLGLYLGLPMPKVAVIEVSDWLVSNSPDLRMDTAGLLTPMQQRVTTGFALRGRS
jgi:hypothetical protein